MSTNNAAHTPGPWRQDGLGGTTVWGADGERVAAYMRPADAALVAEAGTVKHETGLMARQLTEQNAALAESLRQERDARQRELGVLRATAEQRAELLEALQIILPALVLDLRYADEHDDKDALRARIDTVTAAIAKATGGAE